MNATYRLVEIVKQTRKIDSDNKVAQMIDATRQKVSNWKAGQSEGNALNTLRLVKEAGITIEQAIEILESAEREKTIKKIERGFANLESMSLVFVTSLLCTLALAWSNGSSSLYIMLNRVSVKIKGKLLRFAVQNGMKAFSVHLLKAN